jgi:hypothetical protein
LSKEDTEASAIDAENASGGVMSGEGESASCNREQPQ